MEKPTVMLCSQERPHQENNEEEDEIKNKQTNKYEKCKFNAHHQINDNAKR